MGKGAARSASRRRPLIMTFPLSRFPFPGFRLPRPRLPPRLIVQEKNHRPDLPLGEEVLPHRHRRIPRRALAGEAGPALGDAPEHEALGELRDRAVVLEVRGERVEAGCEVSLAVEVVAMTRETVPVVDVFALREVRGEGVGVLAQRVLESRQRDRLAPKRDLGGRRGMDRTQVRRRRDGRRDLAVGDESDKRGHHREHHRAHQREPRLKLVRAVVLAVVTALVGLVAYGQVTTTVAAPPNLRSIHPAPPAEVTFRGKTITLTGLENPLRQHPDSLPAYLTEGKHVYYRNCLPCHGDHLDGQGHFASGFNPLPANFQDNGTIAQLTESFVFWRVAKGGPGLPREGTPWNSAMPAWEEFLTEDEIWSVVLFLYDQTGWKPRTWEKSVSGEK